MAIPEELDTLPVPGAPVEGKEKPETAIEPEKIEKTPEEVAKEERQREIDEAVKKRLAREHRRHEREMEEMRAHYERRAPEVPKPAPGRPDPNDPKWSSHDDYLEALADWKAEQKFTDLRKQLAEETSKKQSQAEQDRQAREWDKRVAKASEDNPKIEESMDRFFGRHFPKTPTIAKAAIESEVGPEIIHYLVTHEDEAEEIADMHYRSAERALLRIEDKILEGKKKPSGTKAPAPLKPVAGGKSTPDPNAEKDDAAWLHKRMGRKA